MKSFDDFIAKGPKLQLSAQTILRRENGINYSTNENKQFYQTLVSGLNKWDTDVSEKKEIASSGSLAGSFVSKFDLESTILESKPKENIQESGAKHRLKCLLSSIHNEQKRRKKIKSRSYRKTCRKNKVFEVIQSTESFTKEENPKSTSEEKLAWNSWVSSSQQNSQSTKNQLPPFPFSSAAQYRESISFPLGLEFNSQKSFRVLNKAKGKFSTGSVVYPSKRKP
eukprot:GHVP01053538.1.p1 GENE.GHVP01053538.1~~GHVP01053538.1.p1  ORF type:complete len:225 (+),score=32.55 GHVP01053538.1:23-697(+)